MSILEALSLLALGYIAFLLGPWLIELLIDSTKWAFKRWAELLRGERVGE
jgi:hypothetical protein